MSDNPEDMKPEDYVPAQDPGGDRPGGDLVSFERDEHGNEVSMFGGTSADVEKSILNSTERNYQLIGRRIMGVSDVVGDLGRGTLQELTLRLDNGKSFRVTGVGLEVHFS